ncbi:DUF302 domain-containing protein [Caldithrix abyssi]|nr:DUF302 domain-containing protein [Caldithrix abyssi]
MAHKRKRGEVVTYGYPRNIDEPFEKVESYVHETLIDAGFGVLTEINVKNTLKEKLGIDFSKYQTLGACRLSL